LAFRMKVDQNTKFSTGFHRAGYCSPDTRCPGCEQLDVISLFAFADVPADCSALMANRQEARGCRKGHIHLASCSNCGLIFNRTFDSSLVQYDGHYDNSLSSSPAFQEYSRNLVDRLRARYHLKRKRIVEIGCGRGDILTAFCEQGWNYGVGYDPSFVECGGSGHGNVRFVKDYYSEAYASEPVDFVCCRHVLEHLEHPFQFLSSLREWLSGHGDVTFYFEVPNAEFVFAGAGIWDIIYPHVSYFTLSAFQSLFRRAAFEILQSGTCFDDQYLYLEARLSGRSTYESETRARGAARHAGHLADIFKEQMTQSVAAWSNYLETSMRHGKHVAFWGTGAKGVTFLNLVPGACAIERVVDTNTRKHGMYVPGTGQLISAPDRLRDYRPDSVIVVNPLYREEISAMLSDLGLRPPVISHPPINAAMRAAAAGY
jgi:SAM-dependent methyltransferase